MPQLFEVFLWNHTSSYTFDNGPINYNVDFTTVKSKFRKKSRSPTKANAIAVVTKLPSCVTHANKGHFEQFLD